MNLYGILSGFCQGHSGPGVRILLGAPPKGDSGLGDLDVGVLVVPIRIDYGVSVDRHYGAIHFYGPNQGTTWESAMGFAEVLRQDCAYLVIDQRVAWDKESALNLTILRTTMLDSGTVRGEDTE